MALEYIHFAVETSKGESLIIETPVVLKDVWFGAEPAFHKKFPDLPKERPEHVILSDGHVWLEDENRNHIFVGAIRGVTIGP